MKTTEEKIKDLQKIKDSVKDERLKSDISNKINLLKGDKTVEK